MDDDYYMSLALEEAQSAFDQGEFPVGCVIVHHGEVIARGARTGTVPGLVNSSELSHAEINALKVLENYKSEKKKDLDDLVLYSTLEPCLMCYAASILAGITRIVFAYEDVMGGGLTCDLKNMSPLYRDCKIKIKSGVGREKSINLFYHFFKNNSNSYWENSLLALYTMEQNY